MKSFQPFRLDEVNQCLWRGDTRVSMTPKPFAVLQYLVEHEGRLVTHDERLIAIWPDTYVQPEVLRRYILEIRRVFGDQAEKPHFVETLPKRGYQFIAPVSESAEIRCESITSTTTKLVGRQSALVDLDRYLKNALRGQRQLVFIAGEAGIGETSRVEGSGLQAAEEFQCILNHRGSDPFSPFYTAASVGGGSGTRDGRKRGGQPASLRAVFNRVD